MVQTHVITSDKESIYISGSRSHESRLPHFEHGGASKLKALLQHRLLQPSFIGRQDVSARFT